MPELPEAETVRAGLERFTRGRHFATVEVFRPQTVRRQGGGVDELAALITGQRIEALVRRGKFVWFELASAVGLGVHLGMSGQFRVRTDGDEPGESRWRPHVRAEFGLDDGTRLAFVDQRLFGYVVAAPLQPTADGLAAGHGSASALLPPHVAHIARDLLDPHLEIDAVLARLARSRAAIKAVLLNQEVVSGLGNIYVDEALWRAQVHPATAAADVPAPTHRAILSCAKDVLRAALAQGGTSFDALYVNVNGESGYFARSLQAYGRAGQPCRRCQAPMERLVVGGRGSHVCPHCQRRPSPPSA